MSAATRTPVRERDSGTGGGAAARPEPRPRPLPEASAPPAAPPRETARPDTWGLPNDSLYVTVVALAGAVAWYARASLYAIAVTALSASAVMLALEVLVLTVRRETGRSVPRYAASFVLYAAAAALATAIGAAVALLLGTA